MSNPYDPRIVNQKFILFVVIIKNSTHVTLDLASQYKHYETIQIIMEEKSVQFMCTLK